MDLLFARTLLERFPGDDVQTLRDGLGRLWSVRSLAAEMLVEIVE
jgi:hypothetical protein